MNRFSQYVNGLSENALRMMHDSIQRCLNEEDNLEPNQVKRYGIREHDDFRLQAEAIELEFENKNISFDKISW